MTTSPYNEEFISIHVGRRLDCNRGTTLRVPLCYMQISSCPYNSGNLAKHRLLPSTTEVVLLHESKIPNGNALQACHKVPRASYGLVQSATVLSPRTTVLADRFLLGIPAHLNRYADPTAHTIIAFAVLHALLCRSKPSDTRDKTCLCPRAFRYTTTRWFYQTQSLGNLGSGR